MSDVPVRGPYLHATSHLALAHEINWGTSVVPEGWKALSDFIIVTQ